MTQERDVFLSANSTATLISSASNTQTLLTATFPRLKEDGPNTTLVPKTGHYVTAIDEMKVVWRTNADRIEVLTILVP